ncbi:hypothetical protein A0056_007715 [Campylobacter jejuni]|nr:hypothetical protein A0056_007715 [Campylobacter jejuni]SUX00064.1 Uncharacterised protein [Campylobacter jejuni subsp. doylei]
MFDYSKYENATPEQLVNALSLVEKKAEKLVLQTKENNELLKFLNEKLKDYKKITIFSKIFNITICIFILILLISLITSLTLYILPFVLDILDTFSQVFTFSQVLDSVAFSEFKKSEIFSSLKFIRDVFTFMFIFLFITMIIHGILKISIKDTIKPKKIFGDFFQVK